MAKRTDPSIIRIGTRSSELALRQARLVQGALEAQGLVSELVTYKTVGDKRLDEPLSSIGAKGLFTKELETDLLTDLMAYMPYPEFGPYESYEPEHTVRGGELLELAGMEIDVLFTPGHSPGHVTYAPRAANAIFSGDVLFQSSIGRTDLPGGDHAQLLGTIAGLIDRFDDETQVLPGHMGVTTLGAERQSNPFLAELARG